ncbi:MAG: FMN-binding negative transcriptional regulator [Candidatus Methylumidiphilus sp.]
MYIPEAFAEPHTDSLHALMRSHPLATVVALSEEGLEANHIPLQVLAEPLPYGRLRGHMARANPAWRGFSPTVEILAIFHGPNAYVSPSWYASAADGKAVPTWNYAVVHAYGRVQIHEEPDWLLAHLRQMSASEEARQAKPWSLDNAPADFITHLLPAIAGIEMTITRLLGKRKLSQNRSAADRHGVALGLRGGDGQAQAVADLIEPAEIVRKP